MDARVLNGIVEDTLPNGFSPASDSEDYAADGLGGFLEDKIKAKVEQLKARAVADLKRLAEEKKNELIQGASDLVRRNTPNFENIYQNALKGVGDSVDNVGKNIAENVFNVDTSGSVGDALNNAAGGALGNVND